MRYVTNNEVAQPDAQVMKRARGRPRKPDAKTNAQRQAAYRARQRSASINATVTKNNTSAQTQAAAASPDRQGEALRHHLARVEAQLRDLKAAKASNSTAPDFEVMLKLLAMACARKPLKAQLAIRESEVWRAGVASASRVSEEQMKRVAAALAGHLINLRYPQKMDEIVR